MERALPIDSSTLQAAYRAGMEARRRFNNKPPSTSFEGAARRAFFDGYYDQHHLMQFERKGMTWEIKTQEYWR